MRGAEGRRGVCAAPGRRGIYTDVPGERLRQQEEHMVDRLMVDGKRFKATRGKKETKKKKKKKKEH